MLLYLNNAQSIGPDSVAGINRGKGLNENFAREILELHTLGVRTGYTQADVISFAKVLTGWTLRSPVTDPDIGGQFLFIPRTHEPGAETVLGKPYSDNGVAQGRSVLADLARHPATATHIATKLATHFVADDPPAALIDRLARCFRDTDGDLKEIAKALIAAPEAWIAAARQVEAPRRMAGRGVARHGASRRHSPLRRGSGAARGAAVATARAQRLPRRQCFLARRPGGTARHRQHVCPTGRAIARSRGGDECRARSACLGRDPPGDRARREPAAGADFSADGSRIPPQVT